MLYTSWTCDHFTDLHYDDVGGTVIFQPGLHNFQQSSSTCKVRHVFMPSKTCFPSCATNGSMAFCSACHCLNGFQRTKQLIIWWYKVRTVGHMQQTLHPNFVMAPVEHRLVCICHHSCQPTSINLGITKHFNNWDSTAFNEGQDGA